MDIPTEVNQFLSKILPIMINKILERSSTCLKIKEKSLNKPNKSINTILTIKEKWESNSKINSSNLKINSAENKSQSQNCSLKSTIYFIKIKMSSLKTKGSKRNLWECKNSTEEKYTNLKLLLTCKQETLKKPLSNTILSFKNSKNKDNNTLSSWHLNLKEKLKIFKKNSKWLKILKE